MLANDRIFQMNNEGISLLQANDYREAAVLFSDALRVVQSKCKTEEQQTLNSPSAQQEDQKKLPTNALNWSEQSCDQPEESSSSPFIYSRPLIVSPSEILAIKNEATAALLFNFALSLHLHSIRIGARGRASLKTCLQLYQQVRELLPDVPALEAVVHFNAGVIYQELSDFSRAKTCFRLCEGFLFNAEQSTYLHHVDRKAMILNTTTFQEPKLAAAA